MDKDNKKRNRAQNKKKGKEDMDMDEECMELDSEDEIKFDEHALKNGNKIKKNDDMVILTLF